ncbi:MAG: cysteine-rich small domain-containing protein [Agathobacter sp.]|nr:cysteine-rich small domain-containing protein [Agathobacter sp.]
MSDKETENFKYFKHDKCEFFPCHKGIDLKDFNCLFCYCPLYMLGKDCGGEFRILDNGIKSCENCNIPHIAKNYDYIVSKYSDIIEIMKNFQEK